MKPTKKPAGSGRAAQQTTSEVYEKPPKKRSRNGAKNTPSAKANNGTKQGPLPPDQAGKWCNVTQDKPCPVCGKPDWCSTMNEQSFVACKRSPETPCTQGWLKTKNKVDKNGQEFSLWRLPSGDDTGLKASGRGGTAEVSSATLCNLVYRTLLQKLPLTRSAEHDLVKRGLSYKEIGRRRYGYLDNERDVAIQVLFNADLDQYLAEVPGFFRDDEGFCSFAGPEGLAVPVRDLDGRIIAIKIRANKPLDGRKYVYVSSSKHGGPGPGTPVHVPLHPAGPVEEVRLTEGELKADVATVKSGILTLGLPGVAGFAKAEPILRALAPKRLRIAFDSDYRTNPAVASALVACIEKYRPLYDVIVETWPPEWGKGIDDVLASGKKPRRHTGEAIDKIISSLTRPTSVSVPSTERPTIEITTEEMTVNDQAVAALSQDTAIYQRGNVLVHILKEQSKPKGIFRPKGNTRIAALPESVLREHLSQAAKWTIRGAKDIVKPSRPPKWSVAAISARGSWPGIRPLEGIVSGPVLRADGTILFTLGYDPLTGLICEPSCKIPDIPNNPTAEDIRRALETLRDAVADFPFEREIHQSAWLTYLLTTLSQYGFSGPAPLYLTDANTPGTGKGLLCDLASVIATGKPMSRMSNPTNDDEARKRITAIAIAGDRHVLIDNIDGTLGSPSFDAALTSETWKDRLLGRSEIVELPLKTIWCATGNNVSLAGDLPRRVMRSRLITELEHPEERTAFRHPKLIKWAKKMRGELLAAALTLLRGYCAAGRPDQRLSAWGSFEGWSGLVRSTVVWVGLPDPAETRQELTHGTDTKTQALAALMAGLQAFDPDRAGLTVSDILRKVSDEQDGRKESAGWIREALVQLCPTANGAFAGPKSIGMTLHHLRSRVVEGRCLESRTRNHTAAWYVRDVETGTTGTAGTISIPSRNDFRSDAPNVNTCMEVDQKGSRTSRSPRPSYDGGEDSEVL